jgi:DNA-binding CsgD family transcriptional regulator/GAF domain-containing protein
VPFEHNDLGKLIAAVYDAALEPERWPDALRRIGGALSDASGILAVHPWSGGVQWAMISDLDPASMPTYEDDFSSKQSNPYFQMCQRVPLGEPIAAETFTAPQDFEQTDFYRAILAPQRLRYSIILTLLRDEERVAAAAFLRSAQAGPFTDGEFELLRELAPHLQRALKLTLRIESLRKQSMSLAEALNVSATGMVLADAQGHVIFVNPAAARVLKEADGFSLRSGRLIVEDPAARRALAGALTRTEHTADGEKADSVEKADSAEKADRVEKTGMEGASALTVPRPTGRQAYNLLVWPLRLGVGVLPVDAPSALIVITDPVSSSRPPLEALATIYGFTPTETALASLLVEGQTLKESASRLGITMNTVKTHMKQLFAKTNTRRQAELIRLVLQFPPLSPR